MAAFSETRMIVRSFPDLLFGREFNLSSTGMANRWRRDRHCEGEKIVAEAFSPIALELGKQARKPRHDIADQHMLYGPWIDCMPYP